MQEDNVSPNVGDYFFIREPIEQTVSRKKERALTLEALPVLKQLVKHLEDQIDHYKSVEAIPNDIKTDPAKFMHAHNAHQIVIHCLTAEKEYIESLLDANAKGL